jgi:outer membrane immunogenic protein
VNGVARSVLFLLFMAFGLAGPAAGGGLSSERAPGTSVDWSGFYLGIHGGYGWSRVDTGLASVDVDGWLGGGHIGVQRQFDRWVLGLEASFSFGELDGHRTLDIGGAPLRLEAAVSDLLLITGRLGYAWDDRLLYVKAGYAAADVEAAVTFLGTTNEVRARLDGWTAGIGLERMVTPNIIIGLEYNYIELGSKSFAVAVPLFNNPDQPPPQKPPKIEPDGIHSVFARLTFKLGAPPAEHVPYK